MATSKGMTEGSNPVVGLPLGLGQGLEEAQAHPRRAAELMEQTGRLLLAVPPPAALLLEKPMKSRSRL